MIAANNPEIDVNQLLQRIREELNRRPADGAAPAAGAAAAAAPAAGAKAPAPAKK